MPLPDYEFYTASYLGEKIPQGKLCTLYYPRRSPAGALQKYV